MIPTKAIKQKQKRDREDQVRKFSGISNKTRKKYLIALREDDWETAHKILSLEVFGFDTDNETF